jgi:hypothetical protein
MPTFRVEFRFHKTMTLTVEAESEQTIYAMLDERGDELDPDFYYKAETFEDWTSNPIDVKEVEGNPKADYIIGTTRFGKDFILKVESERFPGVKP